MDGDRRDDAELVAAVLAGDHEAFGPLLERWQPSILRLCRRLLGPDSQAEDVAQEAAVAAFLGLPRLADPARFGAWLQAIAANQARMALRRRRLALEGLPPHLAEGLLGGEPGPTPEDAWASREVHQAILAALQELPPANREAVIGFYLQGYSYQELAELLGTPLSTVRGRLYHGRRRLRRTLRPLVDELLTPTPTQQEEHRMDTTALLDADVAFVGRLAFSTDCVVMLRERGGPRQLALEPVEAATGEVVERLLGGDQPLAPTTHDLLPRLIAALDGRVQQVTIRRLADQALYGDITLDRGGRRRQVEARPGDAVALALLTGAPIRIVASVLEAAGFDPADRQQQDLREELELARLRRRLAGRAGPPPSSPVAPPPPLDPQVRQQVEDGLERLRADLGGWLALLTHDSGTLVAWAGPGDPTTMARYCQARADRDADLTHLVMREVFPPDQVEAVMVRSVGQLWRVEVGIATEEAEQQRERFIQRTDRAVAELETLLQARMDAIRP